jgi:phage gpG-like protein
MAEYKFGFDEILKKLKQTQRSVMVQLSNQAQNYFVKSFTKQGFNGVEWDNVQRRMQGYKAYKYPRARSRTNPILVETGTLRRAVSAMNRTAEITDDRLRMVVDLPYAARHNEGLKGMPKRQFVGQTDELTQMQTDKIREIVDKIWQR